MHNRVAVYSARAENNVQVAVVAEPVVVQFRAPGGVSDVPHALAGLQLRNVPNPFNPLTEFRFNLPRSADTEIRIYDVRGALMHRVQGGVMAAGPAMLRWAGRDEQGRAVASGVYFYRLSGNDFSQTSKMVMVQ